MSLTNTVIETNNATIKLIDDEIFYVRYHDNAHAEISDFKETFYIYNQLAHGKPLKVLVEMGKHAIATMEAREFAQKNKLPALAEAFVLQSLSHRILVNFYAKFRKQMHPIDSFKDVDSALEWLKSQ